MSARTERLLVSNLYKVALIVLAVTVGTCVWVVMAGKSWPAAAVIAAVLLGTTFAVKTWASRRY